jgi:hypothetical protein
MVVGWLTMFDLPKKLLSRLKSGSMLLADRGYDDDWIRELATNNGAWANLPPKSNRGNPICLVSRLHGFGRG